MSKFLHDADDDDNNDDAKVIAMPRVYSENSRAKKVRHCDRSFNFFFSI